MNSNENTCQIRFEDRFPYDREEYYTVILFFDNMIRRDFQTLLRRMKEGISSMLCDTIGYELPENEDDDCEWKFSGCIELWWVAGDAGHEHVFLISFKMFIECLRLAAKIWILNNSMRNTQVISDLEESIDVIEKRYEKYDSDFCSSQSRSD